MCWIKLSEDGLHICVAMEIWEMPRSSQVGWDHHCAEALPEGDPWKRNLGSSPIS